MRAGQRQKRGPNQPTPCIGCPKGSPAEESQHVLSWRNVRTVQLYLRNRAMMGHLLNEAERGDPLLQRLFAIIDGIVRAADRDDQSRMLTAAIDNLARR